MSVREPGSLSRANDAWLVFDPFLRCWISMKKYKELSSERGTYKTVKSRFRPWL